MKLARIAASVRDATWRLAYRVGFPLARLWWRLRQQPHQGALVAVYVDDDLLLLRSSYRREWNLPGGGVGPGETPGDAARRELREEIGLSVDELALVHVVSGIWDGRPDQVHVHELRLSSLPPLTLDNREIIESRLFGTGELQNLALTGPTIAYLKKTGRLPGSGQMLGTAYIKQAKDRVHV